MEPSTEVDHIVAKSAGGEDDLDNLQGACSRCHKHKTATQDSGFAQHRFKPRAKSAEEIARSKGIWDSLKK